MFKLIIPELAMLTVRLRFDSGGGRFHFLHGAAVHGLLMAAMDNPNARTLPRGVLPLAVESGRVVFQRGDSYNFGLVLTAAAQQQANWWAGRLHESIPKPDQTGPLGRQITLESVEDAWTNDPVSDGVLLFDPREKLYEMAGRIEGATNLTLHFNGPLRLHRLDPTPGHGYLDGTCFDSPHCLSSLLRALNSDFGPLFSVDDPISFKEARCMRNDLLWIDMPYGRDGRGGTLGGACGEVTIEFPSTVGPLAIPLVLGQYTGLGENRRFGLGHYVIKELVPLPGISRPARTLLEHAASRTNLRMAWEQVRRAAGGPGVDGQTIENIDSAVVDLLDQQEIKLRAGDVHTENLLGIIVGKEQGTPRALAIPTVQERWLQRAVVQELTPAIEQFLEDCSFAYRKGFSRTHAADALDRLRKEGYRWVLESEIEHFFGQVEWLRLRARLAALFGDDPVVETLMAWVQAPVEFGGRQIERTHGLPHGAVISSLLASLFLDEFDEAMRAEGFRLVRCAENFVVPAKNPEEAERAGQRAAEILERMGLSFKEVKLRITDFDCGFSYLGYLFYRSRIMEEGNESDKATVFQLSKNGWFDDAEKLQEWCTASWLTELARKEPRSLLETDWQHAESSKAIIEEATTLYVVGDSATLSVSESGLRAGDGQELEDEISWDRMRAVVSIGPTRISQMSLRACLSRSVPVVWCRSDGEYLGISLPASVRPRASLIAAQLAQQEDKAFRLTFSQEIVATNIHNMRVLLADRGEMGGAVLADLSDLERSVAERHTRAELRVTAGHAAALYFGVWKQLVEPFHFTGRRAYPTADPVNALLNFGYTLLYRQSMVSLLLRGLDPWMGIFHDDGGRYAALASDLMEEFRFLVERLVLRMIREKIVTEDNFRRGPLGDSSIRLDKTARKHVLLGFEEQMHSAITPRHLGRAMSYREIIDRQAEQLAACIASGRGSYRGFRIR